MGKVVTDWHCDRLQKLIDTSKGQIVCGGKVNRNIKYVEATVILNPDPNSAAMQEEIFGPVVPVITFKSIDEVINLINSKDKPLAIYYFGKCFSNENSQRIMNETSSGAYVVNDAIVHIVNHGFGFGGVGPSGYGRYGGYDGFKQWSNPKSVMIKPTINMYPYTHMVPPFTPGKQTLIRTLIKVRGDQSTVIIGLKLILAFVLFYIFRDIVLQVVRLGCNQLL